MRKRSKDSAVEREIGLEFDAYSTNGVADLFVCRLTAVRSPETRFARPRGMPGKHQVDVIEDGGLASVVLSEEHCEPTDLELLRGPKRPAIGEVDLAHPHDREI